jgi:hypothetical protein
MAGGEARGGEGPESKGAGRLDTVRRRMAGEGLRRPEERRGGVRRGKERKGKAGRGEDRKRREK